MAWALTSGLRGRSEGHVGCCADVAYLDIHAAYWFKDAASATQWAVVIHGCNGGAGSGYSFVAGQYTVLTHVCTIESCYELLAQACMHLSTASRCKHTARSNNFPLPKGAGSLEMAAFIGRYAKQSMLW